MHVAIVMPPAKVSNEIDTFAVIPGVELDVLGDPRHHPDITRPLTSIRLPWVGSPRRWSAALAWLRGLRGVRWTGPLGAPDVVVSVELFSVTSRQAARLARRLDVPHVVHVAEILDANPLYRVPPWRGNARRTVRGLDAIVCSHTSGARHAMNRGVPSDRVIVVAPGVDTDLFRPATSPPPGSIAITVGELRDDKGVLDVIAAADRALDRLPDDFTLVVVGDGPLRGRVNELASSRPWLEVRGRVPRHTVPEELRRARVFILAPHSRRMWAEQFGFAVIEAMAAGLPVVVTACGALGEVVPPHNPIAAERDLDALAQGLVDSFSDVGRGWGARNRTHAIEEYSVATQGARLAAALDALIERRLDERRRRAGPGAFDAPGA